MSSHCIMQFASPSGHAIAHQPRHSTLLATAHSAINFGRKHAAKLLRAPSGQGRKGPSLRPAASCRHTLTALLRPLADRLFDHAGTLIAVVLARWLMVRSNKAITSSCVVQGASFSDIRRCLAGISLHRVMNGAFGGICLAISRASLVSVPFGSWKLGLAHANDSAATRQWRSPS